MPDICAPTEIYCSYADADEPLLLELEKHLSPLKQQGSIVMWHRHHLLPGTDRSQVINMCIQQATVILFLVSSDFLASEYCTDVEMRRALERHASGEAWIIPILIRAADWRTTPFAHLHCLPSNAKPLAQWRSRDAAWMDVVQGIKAVLEEMRYHTGTLSTKRPHFWMLPYRRNTIFTGREDIFEQLAHAWTIGRQAGHFLPVALCGLGGIGKTQIALEYAHRYCLQYQVVFWTRADTYEALVAGYVTIAEYLNLPQYQERDQTLAVQAVVRWLSTQGKWLLILDNVDNLRVVEPFLPRASGGHLLLTMRANATGRLVHGLHVDVLKPDLGALLLLRRARVLFPDAPLKAALPADIIVAYEIAEALGGLPLALDQAGAYIEETACPLASYRDLYRDRKKELLKRRSLLVGDYAETVATTWSLSFHRVKEQSSLAATLLRCCAFLASDTIPEELIVTGAQHLGLRAACDPAVFNEAIAILLTYSLIRRDPTTATLSIHRLVQEVLLTALPAKTVKQWRVRVIRAVASAFPDVEFAVWMRCERLLPQVLVCANWSELDAIVVREASWVFNEAGLYLQERGQYAEAEQLYLQALAIREREGAELSDIAKSLNGLAVSYWYQGKYEQAEPLYMRALTIREQYLGTEHPLTAHCLDNLAILYRSQGKYDAAEPLSVRALAIRERCLGAEHPDTATSCHNLAILYRCKKKYGQATSLFERALAIWEQHPGDEHPNLAKSLHHLALLYVEQGKYDVAESLHQRALQIKEHQMGPLHPSTANTLIELVALYKQQGRYHEAAAFYLRVLAIQEQRLGVDHPETQECRKIYAALLQMKE